jgi:hypothetical protein
MSDDDAGMTIADLDGVKRYFGLDPAEAPDALVHAVAEGTECGVTLTIEEDGITLFGVVEGSDTLTAQHLLVYPFTGEMLTQALDATSSYRSTSRSSNTTSRGTSSRSCSARPDISCSGHWTICTGSSATPTGRSMLTCGTRASCRTGTRSTRTSR